MKEKKKYEAPAVKKVRLAINNAILAGCHSSPNITPLTGTTTCITEPVGCYTYLPD